MLDRKWSSWLYPEPTGDPGRDRNARTLQFACFLLAFAIGTVAVLNVIAGERRETLAVLFAMAGLVVAAVMNRTGRSAWAARIAILSVLVTAILLVFEARDGFRSHAMLIFPGMLLISVMLQDRASYVTNAGIVLLAVAALGIAERHGLAPATAPPVRTPTGYASIFFVDLNLLVMAVIGSRIARDAQRNVIDLRSSIERSSAVNVELRESAAALRRSELKYRRLHESITDAVGTVDMSGRILEFNPAFETMLGYTAEELRRLTYQELTPERWHAFEARIVAEQILAKGHSEVYEKEYRRCDGTVFPVELRTYLLRDDKSQPVGMWGIIRDITERKRAEQVLRRSEEKFATLFRCSPASIAISDLEDGERAIDVNDAFERLSGYRREEVVGERLAGLWTDPLEYAQAVKQFEQDGWLDDFEFRFRHKDGEVHTGLLSGRAIELNGKKCVITSVIDITERKQAEAELRENRATIERQLHEIEAIYTAAPVGLCVLDADLKWLRMNNRMAEIDGFSVEKHLGRTIVEGLPELAPKLTPVLRQVIESGEPVLDLEVRGTTPAQPGVERTWLASYYPLRGPDRRTAGVNAVVQEITERKRAEAALIESEERFRSLADSAPVIIFQSDAGGNTTFFNRQATSFTGRTLEQLAGYGWLEGIHPDDLDRIMASHWASLETPAMGQRELRLRRGDGEYRWMLVTSSPRFAGAQFAGYIGTIVDITDLRRTHGELLAAQKLESLGVLASGIGHDFNNMLGGILAQSELVSVEIGDDSPAREGIEQIRRIALRGSDTVRQLMAYAGQENTEFRSVDIDKLIGEMLPLLRLSVSKHATLELDFPRDLPGVRANAAQIGQLVMNLIMNASEAIGEREGVIRVHATRVAIGPYSTDVHVANLPEGEYVKLEVSDTGCGIPEEIRGRIFDPFFTTKFPGRGLGLAVVQGIVRGHGGAANVVSSSGAGTAFEVFLPAAGEPAQGNDAVREWAPATGESAGPRLAVFVIEDEEPLRNAVCKLLRKRNFSVVEAQDGTVGVEIFRARHVDIGVVLLDLTMPGMSGRDVLGELRRIRPDVKIIVTTAHSQDAAAASLGGDREWAFIRKPYQIGDLIQLLQESLGS